MLRALQEEYALTVTVYDELHFIVRLHSIASEDYIKKYVEYCIVDHCGYVISLLGCCI